MFCEIILSILSFNSNGCYNLKNPYRFYSLDLSFRKQVVIYTAQLLLLFIYCEQIKASVNCLT